MSRFFSEGEFNRCVPSCSISDMDGEFLDVLDSVRESAGIPLTINCAYRSREWDISKGRSGNSAHCKGRAVDIKCNDSATAYKIVRAAIDNGISRIGVGKSFIHIDNDDTLAQGVIWNYY